jgi:hypothetical protein
LLIQEVKRILYYYNISKYLFKIEPNFIQYTYRTCSRDEGNDNGIARTSHCGLIKLDWINPHQRLRGCLHVCDKDACNQAYYHYFSIWKITVCFNLLIFFYRKDY